MNINVGDIWDNGTYESIVIYGGCIDFCEIDMEQNLPWVMYPEKSKIYFWKRYNEDATQEYKEETGKRIAWYGECKKQGIIDRIKKGGLQLKGQIELEENSVLTI